MDYIKKNHQLFMNSESKQEKEEEKVDSSIKIIEPPRTNIFMNRDKKVVKTKKLRPVTINDSRKILASDTKLFKNPVMAQEAKKAT